jgi:hypothetical protein
MAAITVTTPKKTFLNVFIGLPAATIRYSRVEAGYTLDEHFEIRMVGRFRVAGWNEFAGRFTSPSTAIVQ